MTGVQTCALPIYKYWHNVVNKDGGFISKRVVENVNDELAYLAEIELIDKFKRLGFKLVNMTEGGEGHKGLKVRLGIAVSEETKEKLRQANLGKKQSPETIKKRMETFKKINYHLLLTGGFLFKMIFINYEIHYNRITNGKGVIISILG